MVTLNLEVKLLSPALIGSGGGFGAVIDTDVVFDKIGLPYLPAKRIKGCLRDAATEVAEMFYCAGIHATACSPRDSLPSVFGTIGTAQCNGVHFPDLLLDEYEQNLDWLEFYTSDEDYGAFINRETIIRTFTELRQQTKIDENGRAKDHSLRTIRVLRPGLRFNGTIHLDVPDPDIIRTLQLACLNWKRFGTNRNRGYGNIQCTLNDLEGTLEPVETILGVLCTA